MYNPFFLLLMKIIIEHLEEELYPWCLLEYKHISQIVGRKNLIFTSIKPAQKTKLKLLGKVESKSVLDMNLGKTGFLDPEAKKELSPEDKFDCLVFGGILGDYPPRQRTAEWLAGRRVETRNLGKEQMATDTAVYVAKRITEGKRLNEIKFLDELHLATGKGEEVILPYRYVLEKGKPVLAKGFLQFVKKNGF